MAEMSGMHILVVPSWWPSAGQPIRGIFFTDYVRAFAAARAKVGVLFPDMVSLRMLGRRLRHGLLSANTTTSLPLSARLFWEDLDGIPILRIRGLHTAFG